MTSERWSRPSTRHRRAYRTHSASPAHAGEQYTFASRIVEEQFAHGNGNTFNSSIVKVRVKAFRGVVFWIRLGIIVRRLSV
jgi:hypothetical protein